VFVITGLDTRGRKWWWRKWTGACCAGRPKWVENFSHRCIFAQRTLAEKTINSQSSKYFTNEASTKTERFRLANITVEEV
jgi:hypothetical protein